MKLGEIADIISGQNMTRISVGTASEKVLRTVKVLIPKAIVEGLVIENELGDAGITKEIDNEKCTKEGDIVIKLSSPYDSAMIDSGQTGIVIPSFCAAIRLKESTYNKLYLTAVLNTRAVREGLAARVAGSIRPMIRIADLKDLDLPIIPDADMEDIGKAFLLSGKKRYVLQEMISLEKNIMENIIVSSMEGGI